MAGRLTSHLSAIVADDEQLARDELVFLLQHFPEVELVGTAANGLEALSLIEEAEPDVAFLDVQMPGLDGFGLIRQLKSQGGSLPYFVLTTAFDQYAVDAFRLEALDYLLKPIDRERLSETVQRAQKVMEARMAAAGEGGAFRDGGMVAEDVRPATQRNKILVKNGSRHFVVDAQDIIYATIDSGLITIVTSAIEGESNYRTIEELQSNLDPDSFWRVHRSYLVNINRIREVIPWFKSTYQIRMNDRKGTEIPVSRIQTKRLKRLLKL